MSYLSLEDFGDESAVIPTEAPLPVPANEATGTQISEADRLAAYEEGYRAGWDDATNAQSEDDKKFSADFARVLQEISLTHHEARSHVVTTMEQILSELVNSLLPSMSQDLLEKNLRELMHTHLMEAGDQPIDLVVAPGAAADLQPLVQDFAPAAINLVEEVSVAEGQAFLRIGKTERQVDIAGAVETMRTALSTLLKLNEKGAQS